MTDRFISRAVDGMGLTPRASARFGGGEPDISHLLERYAAATAISPSPSLAARVLRSIAALPKPTATRRYVAALAGGSPRVALEAFRDVLRIALGGSRSSRLVRGQALALVLLTVMAGSAFAAAGAAGVELVLRRIDPSPQALMPVVPPPESSASTAAEMTAPASDSPVPSDPASTDQGGPDQTLAPTPVAGSSDPVGGPGATATLAPTSRPDPTPAPTARPSDPPNPTPRPTETPRATETPGPPDPTATPRPTNNPHPTDTPHPTQHPTTPPEQTEEPKQTEGPDATDAPSSQDPDETNPPDGGGGGGDSGSALPFFSAWWWLW